MAHVVGVPGHLFAAGEQGIAQRTIAPTVADVPLSAGDDLERTVAFFVELHRMRDRTRLRLQVAGRPQHLDDGGLRLLRGLAGERGVVRPGGFVDDGDRRFPDDATVSADDRPRRQVELAPPHHVGQVAERADHRDAGALVGLGERVRVHADFDVEQRRPHGLAEERRVPGIVWMRDETDAGRNQLGSRGLDDDVTAGVVSARRPVKRHRVVRARAFAILEFGLRHGGAEVDVPERRSFLRVRLAAREVVEKCALRRATRVLGDRGVQERPVDRQAESTEEVFEHLLVLCGEFVAELDEVRTRHGNCLVVFRRVAAERRGEARDVRQRRVAGDAEIVLHAPLGG